ncbi:MAG TPA: O-antigen ligase family protein, partial [Bacteroidia bacterium]|nr:O-antigen ligase family protein [Bacteroidia bacterium]
FLTVFLFLLILLIISKVVQKKLISDFTFLKLRIFLLFGFFLIFIGISFFQSLVLSESSYVLSKLSIEFLFYIITSYLLINKELSVCFLLRSIVLFSIIILFYSLYQSLSFLQLSSDFFDNMLSVNASFGHKNLLASILFLNLSFLLVASVELKKGWRIAARVAILLILILVWLLQSKAVMGCIFICFAIFLFLVRKKTMTNKRWVRTGILSAFSLFCLIAAFTLLNKEKFPRIFDKKSSFERLGLWKNSLQMIKDNPITGVGAGNWQVHFPKYGMDKFSMSDVKNGITTFQRPHNDFLWVFCETGLPGLLCYLGIFVMIMFYLVRLLKTKPQTENAWLYPAFFVCILGYLMIACVDFPLERIEHQVVLLLVFSIITAHFYMHKEKELFAQKIILKSPLTYMLFFVPVVFSLVIGIERYKGEYHTQRLYYFERTDQWEPMYEEGKKALNFCYAMDPMSAPIEWYKGVALFSLNNVNGAKTSFENAYEVHPYNIHVINNLASCYERLGNHEKAKEFYLKSLAISSEFEEALLNLSAVYYNEKNSEKAFETIDKCNIHSQNPKYRSFLAVILNSLTDELINKEKTPDVKQKLIKTKQVPDELITIYIESKEKRKSFKEYILTAIK